MRALKHTEFCDGEGHGDPYCRACVQYTREANRPGRFRLFCVILKAVCMVLHWLHAQPGGQSDPYADGTIVLLTVR